MRLVAAIAIFAMVNQQCWAQDEPWLERFPVDTTLLANAKKEKLALWYASTLSKETTAPTFLWFYWLKFDLPDTSRGSFTEENILSNLRFNPWLHCPYKQEHNWIQSIFGEGRTDSTRCRTLVSINLCVLGDDRKPIASIPPWDDFVAKHDSRSTFDGMMYANYVTHNDQFVFYPICNTGLIEGRWSAAIDKQGHLVWFNRIEQKRYSTKEIRETNWKNFFINWNDK
jgi:hypothetical protein